ncbi:MAG: hypothetical protein Q9216_005187, partial [Gyalolechia sp. 2 TL-2023]
MDSTLPYTLEPTVSSNGDYYVDPPHPFAEPYNPSPPQVEVTDAQTIDPRLLEMPMDLQSSTTDSGYTSQSRSPEFVTSVVERPYCIDFDTADPEFYNRGDFYQAPPMMNAGAPCFPVAENRGSGFNGEPLLFLSDDDCCDYSPS